MFASHSFDRTENLMPIRDWDTLLREVHLGWWSQRYGDVSAFSLTPVSLHIVISALRALR
jgi:hypothetical protein